MTQPPDGTTLKGGSTPVHARPTLVFYHRDGAQVAQLEKGRPLVVGRAAPADVEIHDPGLSRQHARFGWDERGIWVEDLQSTNGTVKNGERVTSATVSAGDQIAIGPVIVAVHVVVVGGVVAEKLRGFDGLDRFSATLAEEIVRARTFARPLALLLVRGEDAKDGHVSRWADRVRSQLRPVDRVGIYGPAAVMVALPEATAESVQQLAAALAVGAPPLTCRAVTYPVDGASAEELIAAVQATTRGRTTTSPPRLVADAAVVVNPAMKAVMATVARVAKSPIAVLVHGETGTGKEVIARAIHEGGPRKKHPLRTINCAAIPGMLIESVLFGHEQGAFTGADKQAKGIFEQADRGTVFLDEVGELAAPAQAALLRVLETKKLTRVGGDREIAVDVRVVAATHRDLEAMVEAGRFRQDLLYRLNTLTVSLPPLRERVDEIGPLAMAFLEDARRHAGSAVRTIAPDAMAALQAYAWPGNVRELRNVIDRAVALAEGHAITLAELSEKVRGSAAARPHEAPLAELPEIDDASADGEGYKEHVRRYEARLILQALHKHAGNQTEAAKTLGLPLRTLVHKIKEYGIKKKFDR